MVSTLIPASCLGLILTALEYLLVLRDEIKLIWTRPLRWTTIKLLYVFCQYFSLIAHILNIVFARKITSLYPVPTLVCRWWISYQTIVTYTLLNAMDLVLMMRIYALYHCDWRMGALLGTVFVIRLVLATSTAAIHLPTQPFDEACGTTVTKPVVFSFLVSEMVTQSLILGLTFARQGLASGVVRIRAPVTSLLYRDGAVTYIAVFAGLIAIVIYAQLPHSLRDTTPFVYPVFVSILSMSTCWMIINMQKLAANTPSVSVIDLTAILETSEEQTARDTPS